MINLFDFYHQESKNLHDSLKAAGYDHPTIVINDDGFLPEGVTSPYAFFMGVESGKPRYFNQIETPLFWEISGSGTQAEILTHNEKRADILYASNAPARSVQDVKWQDLKQETRWVDHYNKYGRLFAQTLYQVGEGAVMTTYFATDGSDVIVENHVTQDIVLTANGQMKIFHNKTDFVLYFLEQADYDLSGIFYNTLSIPFLVSHRLQVPGDDTLFWQEGERDDIPGNMSLIMSGESPRTKRIFVQNQAAYQKMLNIASPEETKMISYLGYNYQFKQNNPYQSDAFVLTNSDQIEQIDALIEQLPEVTFHIAALTEMSPQLMARGQKVNVMLYPNISANQIDYLLQQSSFYLDINHYDEVQHICRQAFEHNLVLTGFTNTVHNRNIVASQFIYQPEEVEQLVALIKRGLTSKEELDTILVSQKAAADYCEVSAYQKALGE